MKIEKLNWSIGSKQISWLWDNKPIVKSYRSPLQSVCLLDEGDGVAVVEAYTDSGPRNATILEGDGQERMRLGLPIKSELAVGYDSLYFISGKLSAILVTTSGDFAVEVDPQIGSLSNYRESR